jgi:hypothetical protein
LNPNQRNGNKRNDFTRVQKPKGENMRNLKKKVALLLAVVMLVSLAPVGVFANTADPMVARGHAFRMGARPGELLSGGGEFARAVTVRVPLNDLGMRVAAEAYQPVHASTSDLTSGQHMFLLLELTANQFQGNTGWNRNATMRMNASSLATATNVSHPIAIMMQSTPTTLPNPPANADFGNAANNNTWIPSTGQLHNIQSRHVTNDAIEARLVNADGTPLSTSSVPGVFTVRIGEAFSGGENAALVSRTNEAHGGVASQRTALARVTYSEGEIPENLPGYLEFDIRVHIHGDDMLRADPSLTLSVSRSSRWNRFEPVVRLVENRIIQGQTTGGGIPGIINFTAVGGAQAFQQSLSLPSIRMTPQAQWNVFPRMTNTHFTADGNTRVRNNLNMRFISDPEGAAMAMWGVSNANRPAASAAAIGWMQWYHGDQLLGTDAFIGLGISSSSNPGSITDAGIARRVPVVQGEVIIGNNGMGWPQADVTTFIRQVGWTGVAGTSTPIYGRLGTAREVSDLVTWYTVRLEAPEYYNWQTGGVVGVNTAVVDVPNGIQSSFNRTNANVLVNNQLLPSTDHVRHTNNHNFTTNWENGRHVIYVRVDVARTRIGSENNTFPSIPDILDINGLWLYSDNRAPIVAENISIGIQLGTSAGRTLSTAPWDSFMSIPGLTGTTTLQVGSRDVQGLRLTALGTIPTVLTGRLGTLQTGNNPNNLNQDHYRGVESATVRLAEQIPGSWTMGWASAVNFDFGPNVQIIGADVHMFTITPAATLPAGPVARGAAIVANSYVDFRGWASATEDRLPTGHTHVNFVGGSLAVNAPNRGTADINNRAVMEVTFYMSVEADYQRRVGSADIPVTVSGPGVVNLDTTGLTLNSAGNAEINVARARNIVSVAIPQGSTTLQTGPLSSVANQRINDVVITIESPRDLRANDTFWVYLAGESGIRTWDLNLNPNATLTHNSNDMILTPIRAMHHPFLPDGIAFQVTRMPSANTPVEITLSNLNVTGLVLPEVDYSIVVSGTAVAQNDQSVRIAADSGGLAGTVGLLNVGTFTSTPYAVAAITGAVEETAPPAGQGPGGSGVLPQQGAIRFNSHATSVAGVANAFRWQLVGANNVGFLSAEAFANLVGGSWNGTAMVGPSRITGDTITVTPQVSTAQVNGETFNIAERTGLEPGSVAIIREGNQVLLPLRFFAEAFDYTIQLVGNIIEMN